MAELRLHNLKKRFKHDKEFHKVYTNFMQDMISKDHAELQDEKKCQQGKVWYIPHHVVFHPNKPRKLWVAFDCSAEWHGTSVNKSLMSGPDLTNQIISVLVKFRKEPVAVTADIEAMFYQVFVAEKHRSRLSFLWWENGNYNLLIQTYHMNVHVFGGTSSLSCSNYALRKTAAYNETKYGTKVTETRRNNFYLDDMLKSVSNEETAIKLIQGVRKICADGDFHLTKFVSNNKQVLAFIPEDECREGVFDQDLEFGILLTEKALGIYWNTEEDSTGFEVRFKEKPNTKRGMLSVFSSIYDPLGLVFPLFRKGGK